MPLEFVLGNISFIAVKAVFPRTIVRGTRRDALTAGSAGPEGACLEMV